MAYNPRFQPHTPSYNSNPPPHPPNSSNMAPAYSSNDHNNSNGSASGLDGYPPRNGGYRSGRGGGGGGSARRGGGGGGDRRFSGGGDGGRERERDYPPARMNDDRDYGNRDRERERDRDRNFDFERERERDYGGPPPASYNAPPAQHQDYRDRKIQPGPQADYRAGPPPSPAYDGRSDYSAHGRDRLPEMPYQNGANPGYGVNEWSQPGPSSYSYDQRGSFPPSDRGRDHAPPLAGRGDYQDRRDDRGYGQGSPPPGNYNARDLPPPRSHFSPPISDRSFQHQQSQHPPQTRPDLPAARDADGNFGPYAAHTERRDPVAHQKLIGERVQRERRCRTLFVRNIRFESNPADLLKQFDQYGEIKSHFDLVKNRGMLFITYYDLRAADKAKEAMHGHQITGRPIDVHFSLPRADELKGECTKDKNQGSLLITLANNREADPIHVRRMFARYGDVKELRPGKLPGFAILEYWDSRATTAAIEGLNGTPMEGSSFVIKLVWDEPEEALVGPEHNSLDRESSRPNHARRSSVAPGGEPGPIRTRDSPRRDHVRPAPYPDRKPVPAAGRNESSQDRLQDARKIQDMLNSMVNPTPVNPPSQASPPARAPSQTYQASAPAPTPAPYSNGPHSGNNNNPLPRPPGAGQNGPPQAGRNDQRGGPPSAAGGNNPTPPTRGFQNNPRNGPPPAQTTYNHNHNPPHPHTHTPAYPGPIPAINPNIRPSPVALNPSVLASLSKLNAMGPPSGGPSNFVTGGSNLPQRPVGNQVAPGSSVNANPPPALPGAQAAGEAGSGTTQAMTQLLALLVAQQQK